MGACCRVAAVMPAKSGTVDVHDHTRETRWLECEPWGRGLCIGVRYETQPIGRSFPRPATRALMFPVPLEASRLHEDLQTSRSWQP